MQHSFLVHAQTWLCVSYPCECYSASPCVCWYCQKTKLRYMYEHLLVETMLCALSACMQICVNSWILQLTFIHPLQTVWWFMFVCVCVYSVVPQGLTYSQYQAQDVSHQQEGMRSLLRYPSTHHNTERATVNNTALKADWTAHLLHSSGAQTKRTQHIWVGWWWWWWC